MRRFPPAALALFLLGGCLGSAPPVPRDHYYRIVVAPPPAERAERALPGVVSVAPLEADGLLRERAVLFSPTGRAHEIQQHDYHHWTDPPPRMLQRQLAGFLRGGGLTRSVVTPDLRVKPDFQVTGRIKRLERLLGGGPPRVHAELELALVRLADGRLLVFDSYAAELPSEGAGVAASIMALNRATAAIFDRFLADARQTDLALIPSN